MTYLFILEIQLSDIQTKRKSKQRLQSSSWRNHSHDLWHAESLDTYIRKHFLFLVWWRISSSWRSSCQIFKLKQNLSNARNLTREETIHTTCETRRATTHTLENISCLWFDDVSLHRGVPAGGYHNKTKTIHIWKAFQKNVRNCTFLN